MLRITGLNAWYGNIHALRGIDLEVGRGELVTLVGSNGAGKTTTLKSVAGLLGKISGTIAFEGVDLAGLSPAAVLRSGVALVPEGRWIFSALTVEENLRLGAFSRPGREINRDLERQFELFPILRDRRGQKGGTLSGGEQQMLAIARALMSRPRLLLLDEPSLGLSPLMVRAVFSLIRDIHARGLPVLVIEQNSAMALGLADRGYVIGAGRVVLAGKASDLLRNPKVREVYLGGYTDGDGI